MKQELFANGSYLCYDDYQIEKNPDLVSFLKSDILKEIAETFEKKIIVVLG
ncbi:MAG: hypothetical protein LBO09_08090 [Candidatus Peribacteria bacterium]|jgi:hypothetical protein|nr:hypothetical protein [Candidatus Peribacteria bacterium]